VRPLAIILAASVFLFLFAPLWPQFDRLSWVGYAVCHQVPARSFHFGGHQLPLCCRCSGTFLGALLGLVYHWAIDRHRSAGMPAPWILVFAVVSISLLGIDGLNSYLSFFPGMPYLYEPHNLLRLTTGTFNGLALSIIVYPVLNLTMWREPNPVAAIKGVRQFAPLALLGLAHIAIVYSEFAPLYYPLSILSAVSAIFLLTIINTMIAVILLRRESYARNWEDMLLPAAVGLVLTFLEIAAIDLFRYQATGLAPLQDIVFRLK
jgi:uncharacterized membrane protein